MAWQDFTLKLAHLILVETPAAIAWPVVVWLIWRTHRDQVRDFLIRLIRIGPTGAEAVPPQQQAAPSIEGTLAIPGIASGEAFGVSRVEGRIVATEASDTASMVGHVATPRTSPKQPIDIVLNDVEENIRKYLKQTGQDNLTQDQQKDLFVTEYAKLLINFHFYMISRQIFGTQMAALRQLANSPPQSKRALEPIFEQHIQKTRERGLTPIDFSSWIAFLLNTKLISVDKDGNYVITEMGKQFLEMYSVTTNETTRLF